LRRGERRGTSNLESYMPWERGRGRDGKRATHREHTNTDGVGPKKKRGHERRGVYPGDLGFKRTSLFEKNGTPGGVKRPTRKTKEGTSSSPLRGSLGGWGREKGKRRSINSTANSGSGRKHLTPRRSWTKKRCGKKVRGGSEFFGPNNEKGPREIQT